ncbi:MAG TPA: hypothetical protein VLK89_04785 [Solirubrobacterales bacterium]|nr:hypothetical protein [Solirubrobacterales bacterium]
MIGAENALAGRSQFPKSTPPAINHSVVTGTLSADPQLGRGPNGDPVTLLPIEFPVADPEHPHALWTRASCIVEVPGDRRMWDVGGLLGGAPLLAAGQLSARWVIEDGHTSRRGVIVATLVKAGPAPSRLELPR